MAVMQTSQVAAMVMVVVVMTTIKTSAKHYCQSM
jgi:hypothetical protein